MIKLKHIKTVDGDIPVINRTLDVLKNKTGKSFVVIETKFGGKWISFCMDELDKAITGGNCLRVTYHNSRVDAIKFRV